MQKQKHNIQEHVLLYQSKFFEKYYPEDNNKFENIIQTPISGDIESSKEVSRRSSFDDLGIEANADKKKQSRSNH